MMTVHPYQDDPNCNHSRMARRACIQLPLDVDEIYSSIDTQMLKTLHIILVHLEDLYNGRNPDIVTIKKERGNNFSQCCIKRFKSNFLSYVNEVLFEMVKTSLKDTYVVVRNPTALKN